MSLCGGITGRGGDLGEDPEHTTSGLECLGIPQEELGGATREIWDSLLRLLPPWLRLGLVAGNGRIDG